jgi:hypothetical protein
LSVRWCRSAQSTRSNRVRACAGDAAGRPGDHAASDRCRRALPAPPTRPCLSAQAVCREGGPAVHDARWVGVGGGCSPLALRVITPSPSVLAEDFFQTRRGQLSPAPAPLPSPPTADDEDGGAADRSPGATVPASGVAVPRSAETARMQSAPTRPPAAIAAIPAERIDDDKDDNDSRGSPRIVALAGAAPRRMAKRACPVEMVLLVGPPASGKSTVAARWFAGYVRVNRDTLKTHEKCKDLGGLAVGAQCSRGVTGRLDWRADSVQLHPHGPLGGDRQHEPVARRARQLRRDRPLAQHARALPAGALWPACLPACLPAGAPH